jgi:membrane protease YdiL (CAAX protease family)
VTAEVLGLVAFVGGVGAMLYLAARHALGRPVLSPHPSPFADADPTGVLLLAAASFVGYQAFLALGGPWGAALALVAAAAVYRRFLARLLRPRGGAAWRAGVGLLVVWAALPLVFGLHHALQAMGFVDLQEEVKQLLGREPGWWIMALLAVVVAPVVEEGIFRGLLYPAVRRMAGRFVAVVATSALFGIAHLPPAVWAPLAVLGVFLAWLVETTGSLLPCVVAHAAFNGLTVVQALLQQPG